ncbi:MAG: DUF4129 domain-containing protein [Dehalococcoidia bacterium]
MTLRLRDVSTYLFILAEAVAWFAVLRAVGTAVVRGAFDRLADQVQPSALFPGDGRAAEALALARDGAEHAAGGPPLVLVVVAAFAAFFLVRALGDSGFPLPLSAAVGLAATLVGLHVLVHVSVHNDLRVWEPSGLATALDSSVTGDVDAQSFIADPDPDAVTEASMLLVSTVGLTMLWFRFLIAGRGAVTYERALRSFSIGFAIVLLAAILGQGIESEAPAFIALAYFVLGALSIAVAHMARTRTAEDSVARDAPLALAAVGTLGAIVLIGLLFGLLAALDVQRAFDPFFDLVLGAISRVLYWLLLPVFWLVNWVLSQVLGENGIEIPEQFRRFGEETVRRDEDTDGRLFPTWILQVVRVLAVAAFLWLLYRVSRLLFHLTRRREQETAVEEQRTAARAGSGLSGLMRGLFGVRAQSTWSGDWLRRQPVYRLYARLVDDARDRGVQRDPGDTPIEFARRAGDRLDAPPFDPIGRAFDAARYGRHFPAPESVDALERDLKDWERSHPTSPQ